MRSYSPAAASVASSPSVSAPYCDVPPCSGWEPGYSLSVATGWGWDGGFPWRHGAGGAVDCLSVDFGAGCSRVTAACLPMNGTEFIKLLTTWRIFVHNAVFLGWYQKFLFLWRKKICHFESIPNIPDFLFVWSDGFFLFLTSNFWMIYMTSILTCCARCRGLLWLRERWRFSLDCASWGWWRGVIAGSGGVKFSPSESLGEDETVSLLEWRRRYLIRLWIGTF